jgi:hypothetical protein
MGVETSSDEDSPWDGRLNKFIFVGVTIGGANTVFGANACNGTIVNIKVMVDTALVAQFLRRVFFCGCIMIVSEL